MQGQCLEDHSTWSAGPLVDLKQTHALLQDDLCVEAALNMLARQHLLSEEEIVAGCSPPLQRRVTT